MLVNEFVLMGSVFLFFCWEFQSFYKFVFIFVRILFFCLFWSIRVVYVLFWEQGNKYYRGDKFI